MVVAEETESGKQSATDPGSNVAQRVRKQSSLFQLAHIGIYSSADVHCYSFQCTQAFLLSFVFGGVFNGQNRRRAGAATERARESPE